MSVIIRGYSIFHLFVDKRNSVLNGPPVHIIFHTDGFSEDPDTNGSQQESESSNEFRWTDGNLFWGTTLSKFVATVHGKGDDLAETLGYIVVYRLTLFFFQVYCYAVYHVVSPYLLEQNPC